MTIRELYGRIGGDYDDAIARLQMPALVERFVVRFLDDPSCPELFEAWERGDEDAAFRAAHTAKGVCANLSLSRLESLSSAICEALRPGNDGLRAGTDVDALVSELREAHGRAVAGIREFSNKR